MGNTIILPTSKAKVTFLDEPKGKTIRKMEKATKSMITFDNVAMGEAKDGEAQKPTEASMGIREDLQIEMDFAHELIDVVLDKDENRISATQGWIDELGMKDYMTIKDHVVKMTEGIDFF